MRVGDTVYIGNDASVSEQYEIPAFLRKPAADKLKD
jgi:hypothetical protein